MSLMASTIESRPSSGIPANNANISWPLSSSPSGMSAANILRRAAPAGKSRHDQHRHFENPIEDFPLVLRDLAELIDGLGFDRGNLAPQLVVDGIGKAVLVQQGIRRLHPLPVLPADEQKELFHFALADIGRHRVLDPALLDADVDDFGRIIGQGQVAHGLHHQQKHNEQDGQDGCLQVFDQFEHRITPITINLDRKAGQPVRLSLHLVPKLQ